MEPNLLARAGERGAGAIQIRSGWPAAALAVVVALLVIALL